MAGKKITIEQLAIMMAKGFENIDQRFEQVEQRFEQVDQRIEQVHKQILLLTEDVNLIKADVHDIKMVIKPIEHTNIVQEREIDDLKIRVDRLEQKTGIA